MIGKLRGRVDEIAEDRLTLDVGGVGYNLRLSQRALQSLGQRRDEVTLWVETRASDQDIVLYGFLTAHERSWFCFLSGVQGVGARAALSLLSALTPGDLAQALRANQALRLQAAEGIGGRLATRLLSELSGREFPPTGESVHGADLPDNLYADALAALLGLGYRRGEATGALEQALRENDAREVSSLVSACLKLLSS